MDTQRAEEIIASQRERVRQLIDERDSWKAEANRARSEAMALRERQADADAELTAAAQTCEAASALFDRITTTLATLLDAEGTPDELLATLVQRWETVHEQARLYATLRGQNERLRNECDEHVGEIARLSGEVERLTKERDAADRAGDEWYDRGVQDRAAVDAEDAAEIESERDTLRAEVARLTEALGYWERSSARLRGVAPDQFVAVRAVLRAVDSCYAVECDQQPLYDAIDAWLDAGKPLAEEG